MQDLATFGTLERRADNTLSHLGPNPRRSQILAEPPFQLWKILLSVRDEVTNHTLLCKDKKIITQLQLRGEQDMEHAVMV